MPHMKDFLAAYPDIRLDATLTDATVDLIDSGADVGVRIGALSDSLLIARRLAPQQRMLVASPDYLATRPAPQAPADLADHDCLTFALQPTGSWFYRPEPQSDPVEIAVSGHLRANDSEALLDAVVAGLGIALLPTWLISDELRSGRLVTLLQGWDWLIAPGAERAIWGIYPPKKVVSPKVKSFLNFLGERFGHPAYWDRP